MEQSPRLSRVEHPALPRLEKTQKKEPFLISLGIYGSQFPIQFVQIRSHFADPLEKQRWHLIDPGQNHFSQAIFDFNFR